VSSYNTKKPYRLGWQPRSSKPPLPYFDVRLSDDGKVSCQANVDGRHLRESKRFREAKLYQGAAYVVGTDHQRHRLEDAGSRKAIKILSRKDGKMATYWFSYWPAREESGLDYIAFSPIFIENQ
jgi:hypothetical protein